MGLGCLFLTGGVHGFFLSSFHPPFFYISILGHGMSR